MPQDQSFNIRRALRACLLAAVTMSPCAMAEVAHLVEIDGGFRTTHGLTYKITSDRMVATRPKHRSDKFGDNPYEISLAAFISEAGVVMVHAERVADQSGASNYEDKPGSDWPNDTFRSDGAVCIQVPASEVEGEHDLEWLRENGFEPSGALAFAQYFATTADFNDELVITLMARVPSCGPESGPVTALAPLRANLSVTPAD